MSNSNAAYSGFCKYKKSKFEFRVINLEFVSGQYLKIEAVCYNPHLDYPNNKEKTLKYFTSNLSIQEEELNIALVIVNAIIKKCHLPKDKLHKLCVRNNEVFWIVA